MKKLMKYLSYCFLGISLFFVCCNDSYAKTFSRVDEELFMTVSGNLVPFCESITCHEWSSFVKYGDDENFAYCSDATLGFGGASIGVSSDNKDTDLSSSCPSCGYVSDAVYENSKSCYYGVDGQYGDCSSIVGYIINESLSANEGNPKLQWMRTQITIWIYLGKYGYESIQSWNADFVQYWDRADWARTYIENAWEAYANSRNSIDTSEQDDVAFSVVANDTNFYYYPSGTSCNSGFYRTQSIEVKNNENVNVTFSLGTTSSSPVEICSSNNGITECSSSKEILVGGGETIKVFLKSKYDTNESVRLTVTAHYESGVRDEEVYYDSVRYITSDSKYQGMIQLIVGGVGVDLTVQHKSTKNISLSKEIILKNDCDDTKYDNNSTPTSPVSKVCADKSSDSNDYTASFKDCTCLTLDLGNNRYVSVTVVESSVFRFGNLTPSETLYAGGGFAFAESGITTQYKSIVTWDYANWKNGTPYYYNGNNLSDWDARKIENKINDELMEKIKSSLSLEFSTRDSNDYLNTNMVPFPLNLDINSISFNNRTFEFDSSTIKLTQAYFSSDGRVSYSGQNSTYSISGGNKYYVPMGYSESTFPFNISSVNLSIVDGIDFWYEAKCDKSVQDLYRTLYYRSIDLTNPFPKAGNLTANVPENWRLWYCGTGTICNNITNRNRLENTYQNYPSSPLYKITLNSNKFKKISAMSDYYTSWTNIDRNGVSSFITKMDLFEAYTSNKSYCSIGVFSEDCDKY